MRLATQLKKLSCLLGLIDEKFFLSAKMFITDGSQLKAQPNTLRTILREDGRSETLEREEAPADKVRKTD